MFILAYNVKDVQTKLKNAGHNPGAIDGIYGPKTTGAVSSYQRANGLPVNGVLTPQTYQALSKTAKPVQPVNNSFNPLFNQYKDSASRALINQAQLAAKQGGQQAMETLNDRGILNSTVTADRVAQINTDAVTNVLPQLQQMEAQRKQQEFDNALRQRQLNEQIKYQNAQLALSRQRASRGGGGGSKRTTQRDIDNEATTAIGKRISAFKRPIDFIAQVKREYETTNPALYRSILSQIQRNYPDPYQQLPSWGK